MSDQSTFEQQQDEEALRRLFAQRLPPESLPAGSSEELLQRVLAEVREVYPAPAAVPVQKAHWLERFRSWIGSLRPAQSLALAGAGALVIMLLFVGIARLSPRPLAAVATVIGGDATVLRAHNGSFRTYHDGDVLKVQQGDHILTQSAVVTLSQFANQSAVIESSAHVEIAQLDDANGGTQVEMVVHDGAVRSDIAEHLDDNDRYVIHAPGLEVIAHGTTFTVEVISEAETLVTAQQGEVKVQMGAQSVEVGPGEEVDAVLGQTLQVAHADGKHSGGPPPILVVVEASKGLQIFATPQTGAPLLGKILAGRAIQIEEQDPTGQWYRVCCANGKAGWVRIPVTKPSQ
jgi:hypothetical protein